MKKKEFDERVHLGFLFDCVAREIKSAVKRGVDESSGGQLTMKHGWMLGYLERQEGPVFQSDLEKTFHFPKSTLADMIQYFEKQGYIAKVPVDGDGRKKQIIVTEEGKRFNQIAEGQIMAVDDYVTEGIPEEQIKLLVETLETMRKNAADYKSYIKLKKED